MIASVLPLSVPTPRVNADSFSLSSSSTLAMRRLDTSSHLYYGTGQICSNVTKAFATEKCQAQGSYHVHP